MTFKKIFRKKIIIPAIFFILIGGFIAYRATKPDIDPKDILTDKVVKRDIRQTVLATGQVVSQTDLTLGFKASGFVQAVLAKVGAKVSSGQILASLDQQVELAALKSAQGSLVQARANYQKVLEGARTEEVAVAEAAVKTAEVSQANAKQDLADTTAEQQTLVDNAYRKLLNTDTTATGLIRYDTTATLTVTGTYTGLEEGEYLIKLQSTGLSNFYVQVSGLETYQGLIVRGTPLALGTRGLYLTFGTSGSLSPVDEWVIRIPNKTSSSYVTNYNSYLTAIDTKKTATSSAQAAVATAEATLAQRKAELDLKKAGARPSELEAARAQVLSAEAQVQQAQANLENTIIRAPAGGTVTSVDIKPGEQATALKEAIVLQDVENLYLEANISETNISNVKIGQPVEVTFDALGTDKIYQASVSFIDPASTITSGVVNYKIKAGIGRLPEIRPGLTANMSIETDKKFAVFAILQRAIITRGGKKLVRVITDSVKKTYSEQEIKVGITADEGLQEIVSGLTEGQEIVTFINTK